MLTKTDAIVLHTTRVGEGRIIIDMFTRAHGRLSFVASLPRSAHSALKKQYLEPLTLLSIEADVRQQRQLQTIKGVQLRVPLQGLHTSPDKIAIALFASEFLYHALKGEQQNEPLFDYVTNSIEWLDGAISGYANFHLVLLMHAARFLGFEPNLEEQGRIFDLRAATFTNTEPLHRDVLRGDEAARLRTLMRMDYPTMRLFRLSRSERARIIDVLLLYYRLHLPAFPELRSLAVLHDIYSDR